MPKPYVKHHETTCPACQANLTEDHAVTVEFSNGHQVTNTGYSCVSLTGELADPSGEIAGGRHAGSYCTECGELLDELEPDEPAAKA